MGRRVAARLDAVTRLLDPSCPDFLFRNTPASTHTLFETTAFMRRL